MKKFFLSALLLLSVVTARATGGTQTVVGGGTLVVTWEHITNGVNANWTWTAGSQQVYWQIKVGPTSGSYSIGFPNGTAFPGGQSGSASYTNGGGEIWFMMEVQGTTGGSDITVISKKVYPFEEEEDNTCKITIKLKNTRQIPVTYRLMKGMEQQGGDLTLQPGQTHTETVENIECGAEYKVISRIDDYEFSDGVWIVEDGAVTEETVVEPVPEEKVQGGEDEITPETTVDVPEPQNAPGAPTTPADGSSAWKPPVTSTEGDLHTNTVHREGIDKITTRLDKLQKSIDGEPVAAKTFDQTPDANAKTSYAKSQVVALVSKVPAMPTVTAPGSVSVISFAWATPGVAATTPFSVDFADAAYTAPISIFKALVRAAFAIAFFFLTVRTIRSAFTTT